MRIGMMVDVYQPYVSGVTHSVALCRKAMEDAGHEVFVFTFGRPVPSDDLRVLRSPGLPVGLRYGATEVRLGLRHTLDQQEMLRSMDVLHVHHPFLSGRLALRYRNGPHQPVVFTSHTRYDLHAEAYLPRWLRAPVSAWLVSRLASFCGRCDRVFAPTEDMGNRLRAWGVSCPIEVVTLGVDLGRFEAGATPDRPGSAHGRVVAAFVGRLGPEKNLPFLLACYADVAALHPELMLVVAGDGPERRALEDCARALSIQGRVRFTGLVPYEEVPRLLGEADFFVTPSLSEVQPLSVLEAMAAGLPVLGLDSGGVGAIVEDGVNGCLATDRSSFSAAMQRLVDDRQHRLTMGRAAVETSARYSVTRTALSLLECYENLLSSEHSRGAVQVSCRTS